MTDRHKANPVTFRPPEDDRAWLYAHAAETGRSVGSILNEAVAAYRLAIAAPAGCREPSGYSVVIPEAAVVPGATEGERVKRWAGK